MKYSIKFGVLVLFLFSLTNTIFAQNKTTIKGKQKSEIRKQKSEIEIFYVDVRTPAEFAQGSVKGAVNIPLNQIESQLEQFNGKKKIVTFCKSGKRSSEAIVILEKNGIKNVTNGGGWEEVKEKLAKQ